MPDREEIFLWVRDLTAFSSRGTQTLNGRRSDDYLCARFREFGLTEVQVQEADAFHWHTTRPKLTASGTAFPRALLAAGEFEK